MSVSGADKNLVSRDLSLPGLATLLDPDLLTRRLADVSRSSPTALDRQYIRYKPGTNCLIRYNSGSISALPEIYAKAYTEEFDDKLAKERHRIAQGWAPPGRLWALPEQRVLVREFPFDGRLRSLQVLRDNETQAAFIRRLFPEQRDAGAARLQVLAYKPERRLVAKLSGIESGDVVLKFYGLHAFNRSVANLRHLHQIDCTLMPSLIVKSRRHRVLALAWHPGIIFRGYLSNGRNCREIAAKIGESLALLHEQPTDNRLHEWSLSQEVERLQELTDTLSFLVPRLAPQAQQLCNVISGQLEQATATKQLVHADFHSKQVLVHDNEVRFLDADELAVGPAQLDVGTFIAHLYRDGLCGRIPPAMVGQTVDNFLGGYRAAGGCTDLTHTYIALALLKFSHHPFRACEADWDQQVEKIVQLAAQFVSLHGSATAKEHMS